jgi:hypothetical protein
MIAEYAQASAQNNATPPIIKIFGASPKFCRAITTAKAPTTAKGGIHAANVARYLRLAAGILYFFASLFTVLAATIDPTAVVATQQQQQQHEEHVGVATAPEN